MNQHDKLVVLKYSRSNHESMKLRTQLENNQQQGEVENK